MMRGILSGVLAGLVATQASAQATGERLNFVACPIIRDTANVPCWLSDHEGTRYYLTIQTDISGKVHPPYLGHMALVEGIVGERSVCGGIELVEVHISPLPELAPECDQHLPREARYDLPFDPPRPPGPSRGSLAFGSIQGPEPIEEAPPEGPREFEIPFRYDAQLGSRHPQYLLPAYDAALEMHASRIEVRGYRGGALLSNGEQLLERSDIGQLRAEQAADALREALTGAGLEDIEVTSEAIDAPRPDGIEDWSDRKVIVRVIP